MPTINPRTIKRVFFQYSRLIHIYLSSALFSLLILFCISGITLNHNNWLANQSTQGSVEFTLPANIAQPLKRATAEQPTGLINLQHWLTAEYNLDQRKSVNWQTDLGEIEIDYPLPAGYALVIINQQQGTVLIDYQVGSFWQLMNDLHKGRHTGAVWSWVIDITAALICLFSFTGIIILWQQKSKRVIGFNLVLIGTVLPALIYWTFIPHIQLN
ncbi:PepSY-associated TM helix domain-containing protein [Algibacillus agarilyticus]|uniref:PepSY-associated TM helix domain-containing protein n=1 Tax=Algibacillus agarilyticus TaxID=2234133 RepID=UPI000DCF7978|nr:PepSY-associated TM helix domain-containing protein [Algibacillus agarilyticus]